MPYPNEEEEIIIRNGTLRQLLNYTLKGTKVKTWHLMAFVTLVGFLLGAAIA